MNNKTLFYKIQALLLSAFLASSALCACQENADRYTDSASKRPTSPVLTASEEKKPLSSAQESAHSLENTASENSSFAVSDTSPHSESSVFEKSSLGVSSTLPISSSESEESSPIMAEIITEQIKLNFNNSNVCASELDPSGKEGKFVSYTSWVSTDYIDVSKYVAIRYELGGHRYLQSISFYDKDKNYISGKGTGSICGFSVTRGYAKLPEGAVYARFLNFTGSGEYRDPLEKPQAEGFVGEDSLAAYRASLPHDGMKIVCIGDSLTEGDHGSNTAGVPNKSYINYPFFLARLMECETVNQGRCGITPSGTVSLYKSSGNNFDVADADVILIMLGTNGGLDMNNRPAERRSYQQLIDLIRGHMKEGAQIILMTPPHATTVEGKVNYGYAPWVENAAAAVKKLADKNGLKMIDVYGKSPIQEDMESVYQPNDGLHLGDKGYEVLARFIAEELEKILA